MPDAVSPWREQTEIGKHPGRRWRYRLLLCGTVLLCLCLFHAPLLRLLAAALVVEVPSVAVVVEVPSVAVDALVVFDGDGCCDRAARSFHAGHASTLLLIEPRPRRLQRLGILPSDVELRTQELRRLGVPKDTLVVLPGSAGNDWAAVRRLGTWLSGHPSARVTLLCDPFGSRRLSYILHQVLGAEASRVGLQPIPPRQYDPANWWQQGAGMNAFAAAYLRLGYAWFCGAGAENEWCESDLAECETSPR